MLLKNAIATCCTGQIEGLSVQVLARLLKKGLLVRINHPLIQCNGRQNNPYLQPAAYEDLVKAVEFRNRVLTINSCLRTVMQQHMLHQQKKNGWCGIKAASVPGQSNHQSGLSIDIEDVIGWKACLKRFNWHYIGDFDPMHFDHKSSDGFSVGSFPQKTRHNQSKQLGRLQILEFQKLWNEYCQPSDRLSEDGVWGAKTEYAVANSPCEGFGSKGLRQGDYGNQVAELQFLLQQTLGLSSFKIDSHFGGFTEQAVRQFQQKHNLTVNGIACEETIGLLKVTGHG